jgi:O-antigen ligase
MHISRDRFLEFIVLCALSLLPITFVFQLQLKSVLYVVLLTAAIYLLCTSAEARQTCGAFKSIALAFGLYLPYSLASIWLQHGLPKAADNGVHFLFFLVIAVCFRKLRYQRIFWYGISAAALAAGVLAMYQRFGLDIGRPYGMYGINQIGMSGAIKFGMVTTVFSLLALLAALDKRTPMQIKLWHAGAALVGFAGCLAIDSRGPWFAVVIIGTGMMVGRMVHLNGKRRWLAVFATLSCSIFLVILFYHQLYIRLSSTVDELSAIYGGNFNTSIGARLAMSKAAMTMFIEHPFFGVGMNQFGDHLRHLIASGQASQFISVYDHPHNEYLEALATGGIVGIAYLLWLFGAPFAYFLRHLARRQSNGSNTLAPLGGLITVLSFAFFAVGDNIFDRQMTTSLFAYLILGFAVMTAHKEPVVKA